MANNVEYIISLRDRFSKNISKFENSITRLNNKTNIFKGTLGGLSGMLSGVGIALLAKNMIQLASDAEETASKFDVVFKSVGASANKVAEDLRKNYGLSSKASKQLLSDTGDLLTGFGFTGKQALGLSEEVNKLAVDLASFTNFEGGAEGASQALTKALLGERESVKALGIAILDKDVKARIKQMDAMGKLKGLTDRQKTAYATLTIAQEQSKNSIGDFSRTQDGFANQSRILKARIDDVVVSMGSKLLPMAQKAINIFNSLIDFVKSNSSTFKTLFQVILNALPILAALTAAIVLLNLVMNANPIFLIITGVALLAGAMITLYQKSETFRNILTVIGNLLGIFFNILKKVGMYIFKYFAGQFIALIEIFKRVGNAIWVYLKTPFENIKEVIGNILDWITEKIQSFFRLLSKIPGVSKLISKFKDIGSKIGKGVSKGVTDGAKKVQAQVGIVGTTGVGGVGGVEDSTGVGTTKETKITSAAPRVFNINIGSIGENMTIMSQTIKDGAGQAKQIVLNELLGALNDTQIVLNQ